MNRQIGVADSKYVVLDDPLPPGHVTRARALQILPLKWPISSTTQQWIKLEAKNLAVSMLRWISTQIQRFRFKRGVA